MLIVAIAWIYVVGLMALTEPSIVAGIVTFLFYCVLPLSTLLYIAGSGRRKARRRAEEEAARQARMAPADATADADAADAAAVDAADATNVDTGTDAATGTDASKAPQAGRAAGQIADPGRAAKGED